MTPETPSPSVTTVGERRDAIARIIDPNAWETAESYWEYVAAWAVAANKTDKTKLAMSRKYQAFGDTKVAPSRTKADAILSLESPAQVTGEDRTPAAEWREKGEADPHGDSYDCERATLCGGHLTDDQVAYQTAMLMRGDLNHEAVLQTAKDRIRWLSRKLVEAQAALPPHSDIEGLREALRPFAEQRTSDELMRETGGLASSEWANASVERRIEMMGERRREKDANILRARTVLGGL